MSKTIAHLLSVAAVSLALEAAVITDPFEGSSLDPARWAAPVHDGNGSFVVSGGQLFYRVPQASGEFDGATAFWQGGLPVDANWQAELDVSNSDSPASEDANSSIGLGLMNPASGEVLYIEIYAYNEGSVTRGFFSALEDTENFYGEGDTGQLSVSTGKVRLTYDAASKVVTCNYAAGNGSWQTLTSYGIGGAGGATANRNWNTSEQNKFRLGIAAYSESSAVLASEVWADNFKLTIDSAEPPQLFIARDGDSVRLWWKDTPNARLESRVDLSGGAWANVDLATVTRDPQGNAVLLLPKSGLARFFRLAL